MIQILDCTLRDGGYINNWEFGQKHIMSIFEQLKESNVDIIECGYIKGNVELSLDKTVYPDVMNIKPKEASQSIVYVAMINYGEFNIELLKPCSPNTVDGIRVVFRKQDWEQAIEYAEKVADKGYKVFIQPMATINYSDIELLSLISKVNSFNPEALYIVDSFGVMNKKDLLRLFYLFDNNLNQSVKIGYHAHNNLQLAFSNAQSLVEEVNKRDIIIDASIQGMGRGAGNLNTELFVKFLNESYEAEYNIYPLLKVIDETTSHEYKKNYWGYSLPHYLSATYNCHPNYATYLDEKNTLTIKKIESLLSKITLEKSQTFDKYYIEEIYLEFQNSMIDDQKSIDMLKEKLVGNKIILLAAGKSLEENESEIINLLSREKNSKVISVNFIPENIKSDFLFISNGKRAEKITISNDIYTIRTSNVELQADINYVVNYNRLLNSVDHVSDNAMLMLIKLLRDIGVSEVNIAGFDGYGHQSEYIEVEDESPMTEVTKKRINKGVSMVLTAYLNDMQINWITPSNYSVS